MSWFSKKDKNHSNQRITYIRKQLAHCSDVVFYPIKLNDEISCTLIYIESIIHNESFKQHLLNPLLANKKSHLQTFIEQIEEHAIFPIPTESSLKLDEIIQAILNGKVALLIEKHPIMFLMKLTAYDERSIPEPKNELVIIGSHEAFNENVHTNLSLLRHLIKHPQFKNLKYILGKFTQTEIQLLYIEGLCNPQQLKKIKAKLGQINVENVIGSNFIAEQLGVNTFSPFPQIQFTERPDTMAGALLEGRIGLIVDGTPMTLILPVTFFTMMLSTEDYHQSFIAATWIRWIRYLFVIVSFLLPSTYVAVTTFHPNMIPLELMITITAAREAIPFPTIIEALIMELSFEALREAGIRIPQPIGQTISIIGAIIIGQAAVQAGIVSAPIVIVVSITGIASFVIPHFELGLAFRLLRFPVMLFGGAFGLLGIIISVYIIFAHLIALDSFGIPYMKPLAPLDFQQWRDVFIRLPWKKMNQQTKPYGIQERERQD